MTELDYSHYFWQGQLVRLRPVSLEDADAKFAASLDSPSRQVLQLGVELPTTPQLLRKSLESRIDCKDDGIILFTIETLQAENVGGISLHSRDDKNGHFGFGIVIHRPYWRRGYAADAVRILLKYGFWERRYQKCNSACLDINEASYQLHKKLDFVEEGRVRQQVFFNGQYHDEILFGMTREEFDEQMAS
ncbi:MAG: GNAT family N-acetyltransferase [Trueperaceae bacterium]|nr:GNAT family N-acetyltransferase [Trueperaceae bacterium]